MVFGGMFSKLRFKMFVGFENLKPETEKNSLAMTVNEQQLKHSFPKLEANSISSSRYKAGSREEMKKASL